MANLRGRVDWGMKSKTVDQRTKQIKLFTWIGSSVCVAFAVVFYFLALNRMWSFFVTSIWITVLQIELARFQRDLKKLQQSDTNAPLLQRRGASSTLTSGSTPSTPCPSFKGGEHSVGFGDSQVLKQVHITTKRIAHQIPRRTNHQFIGALKTHNATIPKIATEAPRSMNLMPFRTRPGSSAIVGKYSPSTPNPSFKGGGHVFTRIASISG